MEAQCKVKEEGMFVCLTERQVRDWSQNDDPSSRLNKTPPMGAPKAATGLRMKQGSRCEKKMTER